MTCKDRAEARNRDPARPEAGSSRVRAGHIGVGSGSAWIMDMSSGRVGLGVSIVVY